MALATRCPHCHTTFRVAADQLKLRGGIVRCGTCQQVFDGNAALVDMDAPPPPAPTPALPDFAEPAPAFDVLPAELPPLEYGQGPQVDDVLPFAAPEPEPAHGLAPASDKEYVPLPEPEPAPEPEVEHNVEPEPAPEPGTPTAAALAGPSSMLRMPSSPPRKSAGIAYSPDAAMQARIRGKKGNRKTPAMPAPKARPKPAPVPADPDEPTFVRQGRAREAGNPTRTRLIAGGCVLLLVLVAAQLFMASRDMLAARYPALRPLASSICAAFGCRVSLPAQIDTLAVETGELQTLGNGAFTYTTLLRNQGTLVQAWPSLELTLADANDKALVRRVFAPREYLSPVVSAGGFAGRTEQTVKLSFQLADLKPSGYHIAIFYP
jgi:predicted Zn finger-like uncharacterized protein